MRIRSLYVTNYRNLVDCEVRPQLIHAVTGCNGSGKSNFLHVLPFIAQLISGSDVQRMQVMSGHGWLPSRFTPSSKVTEDDAFKFRLECEILVADVAWQIGYELELTPIEFVTNKVDDTTVWAIKPVKIARELLTAKEVGKPGKNRTLVERTADGQTTLSYFDSRSRSTFSAQGDLSVLKIIEVREGSSFSTEYPVVAAFKEAILTTDLLRLSAAKLIDNSGPSSNIAFDRTPGVVVDHFAPFKLLTNIQNTPSEWNEFKGWMKLLCDVDDILLSKFEVPDAGVAKAGTNFNFILLRQHGSYLSPNELSTGHAMIFGILTALFSFLKHNGAIFLEEPETYLHPKAVVDLLRALRETAERTTVLVSTHSPVLLNDLRPEEVTLMKPARLDGYYTTQSVSEISDAIDQIKRGYTNFGDMLQTNFTLDETK